MLEDSGDYSLFLKKLNTKIEVEEANEKDYQRIAELTLRTNKCCNTIRFTEDELFNSPDLSLYKVNVSDAFGDLGLVGAIGVSNEKIIIFSLSCRALGRNVEEYMLEYSVEKLGVKEIVFKITQKNNWLLEKIRDKKINIITM